MVVVVGCFEALIQRTPYLGMGFFAEPASSQGKRKSLTG